MKFSLPSHAIAAANKYLQSFSKKRRTLAEKLFEARAVESLEKAGDQHFVAEVTDGDESWEADLFLEQAQWSGVCDCDTGDDCQHCYAAVRALLDQAVAEEPVIAVPSKATPGSNSTLTFEEIVAQRLRKKLTEREAGIVRAIQQLHDEHATRERVPSKALTPLLERGKGLNGGDHVLWARPPKDPWETWLFVADFFRTKSLPLPRFMAAITTPEEVDALVSVAGVSADGANGKENGKSAEKEKTPPPLIAFRAVVGAKDVRLEFREGDEGSWAPLKKARFEQMADAHDDGVLRIADDESEIVWNAFMKGGLDNATMSYTARECAAGLRMLLSDPEAAPNVIDAAGKPLSRSEEKLVWKLTQPKKASEKYRLALSRANEDPLPKMFGAVDGDPAFYIAEGIIFPAAPLCDLSADPAKPNLFTRAEMESATGIALLDRLGLPLPDAVANRVARHKARLVIEGWLEDSPREEYLMVRLRADWNGSSPDEVFTLKGWMIPGAAGVVAEEPAGKDKQRDQIVHMDRSALNDVPMLMSQLGASWNGMDQAWVKPLDWDFAEEFSQWLSAIPEDVELELDPALNSLRDGPISAGVRLEVEPSGAGGMDWFDVRAVLDVPDLDLTPEELRALLDAGGGWVRTGEDGWRRLELKWSKEDEEQLADLGLTTGDLSGEPQRLHTLQLASDKATRLMKEESAVEVRRRADELRARVNPSVPSTVAADLRPYQVEGFHFLAYLAANHFGGVLADDMGLGKTLQTLTWLAWLRAQPDCPNLPSIVVCPKSVTANWKSEANRFVPHLRVSIWTGGDAAELKKTVECSDLIVMNFAQLRLQAKTLGTGEWHAVILDEAQAIKNPDSQTTKAACALRAVHRLAVTGTPVENRLLDLWSIFSFGMPGMLGPKSRFSRDYDKPTDPLARRRLSARVRPFLLRRTKSQVAKDLPPRMEEDLLCDLEGKQATLYRAELKRAQQMLLRIKTNKELDKQRFNVLTSLLRLRQICCHAALVDKKAPRSESAKLEALMEMLEPLMEEGHKVLVFSQFVSALEIIEAEIAERQWRCFVLTGATENRGELVNEFQSAEGSAVFLLSLKAGGAGLNLTAASYVVLFDPWWNPAVENQAIDRTHRIGQKQTVNAYRLLIRGSIEEKIRALQRDKSALADEVLGEEAFARGLTLDDLSFLLADE